jgi:hypothetical protein
VLGCADVEGSGCSVAEGIGSRVVVVIGTRGVVAAGVLGDTGVVCGDGATTVESLEEPITITRARTSPITSTVAAAAAIHSQRGDFGGGGGGGGAGGYPAPGGQYAGNCSVGWVMGAP